MNFIWKRKTGRFDSGSNVYVNGIKLAGYSWDSVTNTHKWVGNINLPAVSQLAIREDTEEEIKSHIEKIIEQWCNKVLKNEEIKR